MKPPDLHELLDGPFADAPSNVRLTLIGQLPRTQAVARLKGMLVDGSWLDDVPAWCGMASYVNRPVQSAEVIEQGLLAHALDKLVARDVDDVTASAARQLLERFLRLSRTKHFDWSLPTRLANWLVRDFGPAQAPFAADALSRMLIGDDDHRERWDLALQPLAHALLTQGAAELRRRERPDLCWSLARLMYTTGQHEIIPAALRYMLANPGVAQSRGGKNGQQAWTVVETALAQPNVSPSLCVDFAMSLLVGSSRLADAWAPFANPGVWPLAEATLLGALLAGEFDHLGQRPVSADHADLARVCDLNPPEPALNAWQALFEHQDPSASLRFRQTRTIALVLGAAQRVSTSTQVLVEAVDASHRWHQWVGLAFREFFRLHRIFDLGTTPAIRIAFGQFSGSQNTWQGLGVALSQALRESPETPALKHAKILAELWPNPDQIQTETLVRSLPIRDAKLVLPAAETLWRAHMPVMLRELERLLTHEWRGLLGGVDMAVLLRGVHGLEARRIDDGSDDKVTVKAGILTFDSAYLEMQLNAPRISDVAMARCLLYAVHELIHIEQVIGSKPTVTALRMTGAEATLMHFDLGADHAAAAVVAELRPDWELAWLKDVQGRSLVDFPAGKGHPKPARARKANRLVGLRLDRLARQNPKLLGQIGDGYVFAEFSPGSGVFLALASGPPMKVLVRSHVSAAGLGVLDMAADAAEQPAVAIANVDAVLKSLLEHPVGPVDDLFGPA